MPTQLKSSSSRTAFGLPGRSSTWGRPVSTSRPQRIFRWTSSGQSSPVCHWIAGLESPRKLVAVDRVLPDQRLKLSGFGGRRTPQVKRNPLGSAQGPFLGAIAAHGLTA